LRSPLRKTLSPSPFLYDPRGHSLALDLRWALLPDWLLFLLLGPPFLVLPPWVFRAALSLDAYFFFFLFLSAPASSERSLRDGSDLSASLAVFRSPSSPSRSFFFFGMRTQRNVDERGMRRRAFLEKIGYPFGIFFPDFLAPLSLLKIFFTALITQLTE